MRGAARRGPASRGIGAAPGGGGEAGAGAALALRSRKPRRQRPELRQRRLSAHGCEIRIGEQLEHLLKTGGRGLRIVAIERGLRLCVTVPE